MTSSGSVGGAVWGSLLNAANKVTDTISSLTTQNNSPAPGLNRSVTAAPPDDDNVTNLVRPRSQTLPESGSIPLVAEEEIDEMPKQMAIDTLGQGELSLRELGFDTDSPNMPRSSAESSTHAVDIQEGQEQTDFATRGTIDLNGQLEHRRNESIGRSRRSLTVPTRGADSIDTERRLTPITPRKPRRLSNLSKREASRRDESVASRASSDAATADNASRRPRKRSSLVMENGFDSPPKLRPAGTPDASEDRENEDGLYIHGKDGKKRRVPITGFAVQSGKRNRDFHALFKSVEESDYLIEGNTACENTNRRLLLCTFKRNSSTRADVCF
jgi:hypothetical protein